MERVAPPIHRHCFLDLDDAAQTRERLDGARRRYLQTEPGALRLEVVGATVASTRLFRAWLSRGAMMTFRPPAAGGLLWHARTPTGALRWAGKEIGREGFVLCEGEPAEGSVSAAGEALQIAFEHAALAAHAARTGRVLPLDRTRGQRALRVAADVTARWRARVEHVLRTILAEPEVLEFGASRAALEQTLLAETIEVLGFDPALEALAAPARRRRAVSRVLEHLHDGEERATTVADLCAVAEVSQRTLELALREALGITPVRLLKLHRLHGVRSELSRASAPTSVTRVAMEWGFWDLGHFAVDYRLAFGETPSATLRRVAGPRAAAAPDR